MVREIVYDGDAFHFTSHLAASAYASEGRERFGDRFALDSPRFCGDDHREAIAHVELAN